MKKKRNKGQGSRETAGAGQSACKPEVLSSIPRAHIMRSRMWWHSTHSQATGEADKQTLRVVGQPASPSLRGKFQTRERPRLKKQGGNKHLRTDTHAHRKRKISENK